MTTKKRIRAQDLMSIYKEGEIFQAYVDHNPYGDAGRTKLQFVRYPSNISSYGYHQRNIGGVSYEYNNEWSNRYVGFFEIVEEEEESTNHQYQRPEIYPVGTAVEILENARDCREYQDWNSDRKAMIGKEYVIEKVYDDYAGVSYKLAIYNDFGQIFPHYCLKRIHKTQLTKQEVADKFGLDINELEII